MRNKHSRLEGGMGQGSERCESLGQHWPDTPGRMKGKLSTTSGDAWVCCCRGGMQPSWGTAFPPFPHPTWMVWWSNSNICSIIIAVPALVPASHCLWQQMCAFTLKYNFHTQQFWILVMVVVLKVQTVLILSTVCKMTWEIWHDLGDSFVPFLYHQVYLWENSKCDDCELFLGLSNGPKPLLTIVPDFGENHWKTIDVNG